MILDIAALLRGGFTNLDQIKAIIDQPARAHGLTVMVVDDSITVRKVTARLLERNDMSVITAKDGVDAVSKLQDNIPDIMLLDIEMPRMDGFELATHVRNEPRLRDIPIIMITSRTGDKHRQRAMQIGVNRYLGKPFQESDLVENIESLLKELKADG
jgi:chemosensory pili system protein ChpA (sensor histidine kinase/response regulator)